MRGAAGERYRLACALTFAGNTDSCGRRLLLLHYSVIGAPGKALNCRLSHIRRKIIMRNTTRLLSAALRRMLLPLVLCLGLSGCMVMSTNQDNTLPKPAATPPNQPIAKTVVPTPPVEMAYIIHLSHTPRNPNNRLDEAANEAVAWKLALKPLVPPEHVLVTGPGTPPLAPALAAFCRTHPVVEIYYQQGELTFSYFIRGLGAMTLNMASMGWLPLPFSTPYTARFNLVLPHDGPVAATPASVTERAKFASLDAPEPHVNKDYSFDRQETFAPFMFLPIGDEYSVWLVPPCQGCRAEKIDQVDRTDWRIEEKRRLLAQFFREIGPQLEQYALRNKIAQGETRP